MIRQIIKTIEETTGLSCYPLLTDAIGECIVYTYEPIADDGVKKQDRLTIRIITEHIPEGRMYSAQIRNLLLTIGDSSKIEDILNCYINGGGTIRDNDTHYLHTIEYYYITSKSEVNL